MLVPPTLGKFSTAPNFTSHCGVRGIYALLTGSSGTVLQSDYSVTELPSASSRGVRRPGDASSANTGGLPRGTGRRLEVD